MACARRDRIGTIPKLWVLGAMCQIQGYTLHLRHTRLSAALLQQFNLTLPGG